ncbi:MAG: VWA domain-containing protein, partial [Muribaculaceae bacterium]|nr:VWA domain-containing protein [Muribaculaceae bacterium]
MWNPFKNNMRENEQAGENNHGGAGNRDENCRRPADWQVDPKKAQIHNLIIVDESGSMSGLEKVTVGGITETIATIKKAQEDFGDTQQHYLTLVTFDTGGRNVPPIRTHIDDVPIVAVNGFNDYHPRGGTPLFDAMGETLTRLYESIKDNANATGVVTVITDGMENSSREWTGDALRHLIEQLKEEGWTFSYMGSCHDVVEVTMRLSIDHVMEFDHDAVGASNTWRRDMSSKQAYYERMAREFDPNEELAM